MKIENYFIPTTPEEAYNTLENYDGTIIGGGAFLHLGKRNIKNAVDISKLGLSFIRECDSVIEIGAMTTLREIEKSDILKNYYDGILSKTASVIIGVQVRNMATIGGALGGKYGFSDMLTSLLALNAKIVLFKAGAIELEEYLRGNLNKDIVIKVLIDKKNIKAKYLNLRNTTTDFSILNAAVSLSDNKCRISVGARPAAASLAFEAMEYINGNGINFESAQRAGELAKNTLTFGKDVRSSAEYRKELCQVLVKRALLEVGK